MHRFLRKLLLCIPLLWLFCLPAAAAVGQPRSGGSYEVLYRNSLGASGCSHHSLLQRPVLFASGYRIRCRACPCQPDYEPFGLYHMDSYTDYAVQGNVGREANLAAAYKQLGFSNAVYFHYDKSRNDPSDSAAYSFAQKTWTENGQTKTILAVFPAGCRLRCRVGKQSASG